MAVYGGGDRAARIDRVLERYLAHHMFSGSVLVAEAGEVIYQKGHGLANREWGTPHDPHVKFGVASLTKSFTAILAMQLVQAGKLDTAKVIAAYLPDYPSPNGRRITLHHLLAHRSGIPHYIQIPGWFEGKFKQPIDDGEFLKIITALDLNFEPGSNQRYSNSNYFILGLIIEKVTGQSYDAVLHGNILKPLGMAESGCDHRGDILTKRAPAYVWSPDGGYRNADYVNMEVFKGTAGIYTTVGDLFKLDQALYSEKLLSRASKEILFNPEAPYGWNVEQRQLKGGSEPRETIGYNGSINGFDAMVTRFVADRHAVILLSNSSTGYDVLYDLTDDIAAVLYDLPMAAEKLPASFCLTQAWFDGDFEQAIARVRAHQSDYALDERRLNQLGYRLRYTPRLKDATAVFRLNTELFPRSAAAFHHLAEAYRAQENRPLAVENYRKSLALDPDNPAARAILSEWKTPMTAEPHPPPKHR